MQDIDLVHCRIRSVPALRLERFTKVEVKCLGYYLWLDFLGAYKLHRQKLCLRQNLVSRIEFPSSLGSTLRELDLYDNLVSHLKGLDHLTNLTSLDFSFNRVKHIRNLGHMKELKDLYFVQNRIQKIEGLSALVKLRNLELASNRIRVCHFFWA